MATKNYSNGTYNGDVNSSGVEHGWGEYRWTESGARYEGDWVNGQRTGTGTYYYPSGNVYTGNPVVLKGQVSLETEDGVPMGSVLITRDEAFSTKILFQSEVQAGWHFRFVSNGEVVADRILDEKK